MRFIRSLLCVFAALASAGAATFNQYGFTVQEIQTQPNPPGIGHSVATVNLVKSSTTYVCWFVIDDAAGYGKAMFAQLLTAQAAGSFVDFEYSDIAATVYTQDNPTTAARLNLWSVSTHP
jgi:hypothetical protein